MIGIIPAAGRAERMGGIPKFLLPVPGGFLLDRLILNMSLPDVSIVVGASFENEDLINEFVRSDLFMSVNSTKTMCETVIIASRVLDSVKHKRKKQEGVLFGMPDTYFEDDQAFIRLAASLDNGADVAVGVFRTRPEQRSKLGMVRANGDRVEQIIDKPAETDLTWAWGVLAWKPVFWQYVHAEDSAIGYALTHAIDAGLDVRAVQMEGQYFDCGTPDEYFALIRYLTEVRDAV